MEKLQSIMNELSDCEVRLGEILHDVAEAEFPNIVCDNLHLILALMSNCKSQINFSETIKYLKKEDAVMVEMCKNCQGIVNESSKEAPVNGGTSESSILRNHITNPQPVTSTSTNSTNTSELNEETLSAGHGEPLIKMEVLEDSDDDDNSDTNENDSNENDPLTLNPVVPRPKRREIRPPPFAGARRPDPTRLPGPPPPPSVSKVQRANTKDKREKNKKRGINNLFPPWSGQTVEEKANIMVRRHDNNYYVDYTLDRIQELPEIERPNQVVSSELRDELLSCMSFYRNRNLSWVMKQDLQDCKDFRAKLSGYRFTSLSQVNDEASEIWKKNSPDYNPALATNIKGSPGIRMRKRKWKRVLVDEKDQENGDINNEISAEVSIGSDYANPKPGTSKQAVNGDRNFAYTSANNTNPQAGTSKQVLNGDMNYSYTSSDNTNPQPGTSKSSGSSDMTNPQPGTSRSSTSSNDTNPQPITSRSRDPHSQGISGINLLFPPFLGQTVEEKAYIIVRRHDNNYYVDYTVDDIQELPVIEQPNQVVTKELRDQLLSKNSYYRNRNLSWVMKQDIQACQDFRAKLSDYYFTSLASARNEATEIWKKYCPDYNPSCATNIKGTGGVRLRKRKRDD